MLTSSKVSYKNQIDDDKPNEDGYLCDDQNGLYIIMDGVSRDKENGKYPMPSPSAEVTKIFIESAYKFYISNKDKYPVEVLLSGMMAFGNCKIAESNNCKHWVNNFLPGTVGIILIFCNPAKIAYAYIGDCYGAIINHSLNFFTRCQTEGVTKNRKRFTRTEVRNNICNNIIHPYGYGVLNGSVAALSFVEYGERTLSQGDKIVLCTDGFADIFKATTSDTLYFASPYQLVQYSSSLDDKTLIMINGESNDK